MAILTGYVLTILTVDELECRFYAPYGEFSTELSTASVEK